MNVKNLIIAVLVVLAALVLGGAPQARAVDVQGVAPVGSPTTGTGAIRPVLMAAATPSNALGLLGIDAAGNLFVNMGQLLVKSDANKVNVQPTASNGSTAVTLVSSSSGKVVYLGTLLFDNEDSVTHTYQVLSSGGRVISRFQLPAAGGFVLDGRGDLATDSGESLQFKIDASGTGNLSYASGAAFRE